MSYTSIMVGSLVWILLAAAMLYLHHIWHKGPRGND